MSLLSSGEKLSPDTPTPEQVAARDANARELAAAAEARKAVLRKAERSEGAGVITDMNERVNAARSDSPPEGDQQLAA